MYLDYRVSVFSFPCMKLKKLELWGSACFDHDTGKPCDLSGSLNEPVLMELLICSCQYIV